MRTLAVLITIAVIGSVVAEISGPPRRYLVSGDDHDVQTIYVWPEEEVQLICRPARATGCRWRTGNRHVGDSCQLLTTARGIIKCMQGNQIAGHIQLDEPSDQEVAHIPEVTDFYRRSWSYHRWNRFDKQKMESFYLCAHTGVIIDKDGLCDGIDQCGSGEDERGCPLLCGPPSVREHSSLAGTARSLYPNGANVSYTCDEGFAFWETLSVARRTCRRGTWTDQPPLCLRNQAFGRPVDVNGHLMPGASPAVVVDGRSDTWCILVPSVQAQSLIVHLPAAVDRVLARSLNPRLGVSLQGSDGIGDWVPCPCSNASAAANFPEISGLSVCSCPAGDLLGPVDLVVSSPASTLRSMSVAEIAALEEREVAPDCQYLDRPAHGSYEETGGDSVRLVCSPGYQPSHDRSVLCGDISSGHDVPLCLHVTCPPPPAIPHAVIRASNGTGWSAVTEYACAAGYELYPYEQRTVAVCEDGLWSLSYISCLAETDIRVVALRLSEAHERRVAELRAELTALLAGQQLLLGQLIDTQHRLRLLEEHIGLAWLEDEEGGQQQLTDSEAVAQTLPPSLTTQPDGGTAQPEPVALDQRNETDITSEIATELYGRQLTPDAL